jgi:hypothetical protein
MRGPGETASISIAQADPHLVTLADEFLPVYDVCDAVAVVVDADLHVTWQALMRADLIEVGRRKPLVGVLGALRMLPDLAAQILHGERPSAPEQMTGAHVLVNGLLEVVREDAEAQPHV